MAERRKSNGGDVVINVSDKEASKDPIASPPFTAPASPDNSKPVPLNIPAPEIYKFSGSVHKPPKVPSPNSEGLVRRRSFARSVYSKSKSRFEEQTSYRYDKSDKSDKSDGEESGGTLREQFNAPSFSRHSFNKSSPNSKSTRSVASAALSRVAEDADEEPDENEEIYKKVKLNRAKRSGMRFSTMLELLMFVATLSILIVSLTIDKVTKHRIWGLEVWKWSVLVMVTISGMLVTNWVMHFTVFLIEKNYLLRKKVLYFVHGLKKNVQVVIWFALILTAWVILFEDEESHKRSRKTRKFLHYVTWTIVTLLIGSIIFFVKTFALKVLASKFNVRNFFERIQESVFHQYILQTLSGPALIEEAESVGREPSTGHLSFTKTKKGSVKEKKVIDMGKVHKMKQEKVSAWTMRVLIEAVGGSGLSTISNTLDEISNEKKTDKEITNEMEAVAAAYEIFNNVAKPNSSYIEEEDLMRFMIKEEVDLVLPLIDGADSGKITRSAFTEWVVKVHTSRKALGHSLNDTRTAVKQVDKILTGVLTIVTFLIWLVLLDIASNKFLLAMSTQFVGLAFIIGSTCKNIFESFMFVFVVHPYDVGDRCVIDGVMLLVEEIHLMTTVFLKIDFEKVFYPNVVLNTKPISNFYRSPHMGDAVEFSIAFSTPAEKIATLKEEIAEYLEQNPQYWYPEPLLMVKAIENVNKLKLNVLFLHTMNFQNFAEKNVRRTHLVLALKRILEDLQIEYTLLPQDVHLTGHNK